MGNLLHVQRGQRSDAKAAHTAASQCKTVSKFCNTHLLKKWLLLCDIALTHNFPDIWIELATGNGNCEHETIKMRARAVATGLGDTNLAPVITPDLSKKIVGVCLAGNNFIDFANSVNPFLMVAQDCTSPGTKKHYFDALFRASDCDTLIGGAAAAELSDIRSMQTPIKVQIPTACISMCLLLQGFNIPLAMLLKPSHHLVLELSHFNVKLINKKPFYVGHLQGVDPKYNPTCMLRCIQLHTWAFFVDVLNADVAEAATAPVPQFQARLHDVMVGNMSWLPMLPQQYHSITLPKVLDPKTKTKIDDPNSNKKSA